jgi:hypothetical protein
MKSSDTKARFEAALAASEPVSALHDLSRTLKDEGMSQKTMLDLFTECQLQHRDDTDEQLYDAIYDTMDYISGWCHSSYRLFDIDDTYKH